MRTKNKLLLCMLVATVLVGIVAVAFTGCSKTISPIDLTPVSVFMDQDYYIGTGNTLDLSAAFPGATGFAYEGDNATVDGTTMTATAEGEGSLSFTDANGTAVTKKLYAVDGMNVFTEEEIRAQIAAGKNMVLHADIETTGKESFEMDELSFYGNGHVMIVNSIIVNEGAFVATKKGLHLQDLQVIGKKVVEGDGSKLEDFEEYGALVDISAEDADIKVGDAWGYHPSVVKNCVLENGKKLMWLDGVNLTVEGCILRNAADAIIASRTSGKTGSTVTLKNNVLINSVVAGFLFCGWNAAEEDSQQTLNIEGFLDIYNWKSTDNAKLMPSNEDFAFIVNGLVKKEMNKKEYQPYIHKEGGKDYVHIGIVRLATDKLKQQTPTINGLENANLEEKNFPIPKAAMDLGIVKTCILYSFPNDGNPPIGPTATIADNPNIYQELRNGRNA